MKPFGEQVIFHPSELMRERRPELFSDSETYDEPQLAREVFDHYLETLTNRKEEYEFEHFCRRLAEKRICANLVPQTGPTGGGDGKVDTETYPVSDSVSERWYEGIGREASQERWAFAFSAKKKWRPKILADVAKIVGTQRGYKLIYFITNQYVPAKKGSEVEDELRQKYSLDVRILDRTWIMNSVFENDLIRLAIETLGITDLSEKQKKKTGPRDFRRQEALTTLEKEISDPERYKGVEYQLAEDCLQACLLARHLEISRIEIEGRFERAERIAEKVGHRQQILRVRYTKAWTLFWWYNDFDALNKIYDLVERSAVGTEQAHDLQLLSNLWHCLHMGIMSGKLDSSKTNFETRTLTLKTELDRLSADVNRPNNALLARTIRTVAELIPVVVTDPTKRDAILEEFKKILLASEGLGSFPLQTLSTIIGDLGEFIADSASYDSLFEQLIEVIRRRSNDAEVGKALLQRGMQKLQGGRKYEAIRLLGRAQHKLGMEENRVDRIIALIACGSAYQASGLLWAARASFLAASNLAFSEFTEKGKLLPRMLVCTRRVVWVELLLGRVPGVLAWTELMSVVANGLMLDGEELEDNLNDRKILDRIFGLLLLKTELWELKWLNFLPDILKKLQFDASRMALLYALGHEDRLRSEEVIPQEDDQRAVRDFFLHWLTQPAASELPDKPDLVRGQKAKLFSMVLGCEITAHCVNNPSSIYLGETILGFVEAFMATSTGGKAFPNCSNCSLLIRPFDFVGDLPEYKISQKTASIEVDIRHSSRIDLKTRNTQEALRLWITELAAQIIVRLFSMPDLEIYFTRLAHDELVFLRAWLSADTHIVVANILGQSPKFSLSDWESDAEERFYLNRQSLWYDGLEDEINSRGTTRIYEKTQTGASNKSVDAPQIEHRNVRVSSLINQSLWDKAGWSGMFYIIFEDLKQPPLLALGFKDAASGKAIFDEWISEMGRIDLNEQLSVSIITGIDKNRPFSYKARIGARTDIRADSKSEFLVMISRIRRVDPSDHVNLRNFVERYKQIGRYVLLPIQMTNGIASSEPFWNCGISKRTITVRPAWTIGEHDPDVDVLCDDEDPVIPDEITDPPVLNVLKSRPNK